MRSCTGWPSGVWIDPQPRRTAPDGSNFQLQHWTHTFDYALVSGDGDWRSAAVPARSAEFSHPLLAVAGKRKRRRRIAGLGLAAGDRAGRLRPAGCAEGGGQPAGIRQQPARRPERGGGGPSRRNIRGDQPMSRSHPGCTGFRRRRASTCSRSRACRSTAHSRESPCTATRSPPMLTQLNMPQLLDADHTLLAPEVEAAQPLYARYWLHNRGPAPLGGLPAVAHLHPQASVAEPNDQVVLRLTAASDCTDSVLHGTVRLVCPDGWTASPASLPFVLPSGEHLEADIELTMPPDTPPGLYPVRAQLAVTGDDAESMPASWRQVVEDVAHRRRSVRRRRTTTWCTWSASPPTWRWPPARRRDWRSPSAPSAGASLALEAHLISPWGTWEWIGPAAQGAVLRPARQSELGFDVTPPPWVQPGEWWALVRVGCAGPAALFARREGDGPMSHPHVAATVAGCRCARRRRRRAGGAAARHGARRGAAAGGHQRRPPAAPLADAAAGDRAGDRRRGRRGRADRRRAPDGRRTAARQFGAAGDRQRGRGGVGRPARPGDVRPRHGRRRRHRRRRGRLPRPQPAALRERRRTPETAGAQRQWSPRRWMPCAR